MARFTIHELLTELQTKLSTEYGISAITRYYFVGDIAELPTEPAYFLEPGTLTINRINPLSLGRTLRARADSVDYLGASRAF